ncbi:MAG: type II toxin-antitoxin system RelE/ParE family toxin [Parcubacteria group bacterium]|nr:type II toxin-antitoxin system RelE/ParE family toxin [Parcubacteria group bacterium]
MRDWRVYIASSAEREVKKLPLEVRRFVLDEFPDIVRQAPLVGGLLSGPLAWLRSFHFSAKGQLYRIAYSVDVKDSKIYVHYVGPRGGFYGRLRQSLGY